MGSSKNLKLKCPSCSVEHDLNDYPGAFEIPCSCGYSILVPDVDAFLNQDPGEETRFESRVPTSMEAEDEAIKVEAQAVDVAGDLSFEIINPEDAPENSGGAAAMTTPEKLPQEMAYDPFELPAEIQANNEPDLSPEVPMTQAGAIIQKSQLASFGQLVGPSYLVLLRDLNREQKLEILHRVESMLRERPWLDDYCRKNKLKLEDIVEKNEVDAVPEILAVELFLIAIELGGDAEVRSVSV